MLEKVMDLRGCSQEISRLRFYLDLVGFSSRFGFQVPSEAIANDANGAAAAAPTLLSMARREMVDANARVLLVPRSS